MPFLLKRGANNLPLEVQRWQYFLRKQGIVQAGRIDAQYGLKTETATKFFQAAHGIVNLTGELDKPTLDAARSLGYTVQPSDYYDDKNSASYPPKPKKLKSPTNASRNAALGCFKFRQSPLANRGDPDEVVILGSCDGSTPDWQKANISDVSVTQPIFAAGFDGQITCHRKAATAVLALFAKWAELDLLHLVIAYSGSFSPRYKRGQSPSPAGHDVEKSEDIRELSNHSFGSAFDINVAENGFKKQPALCPGKGCVRELVEPANALGFYWGGHFGSPKDGMHFEFADF